MIWQFNCVTDFVSDEVSAGISKLLIAVAGFILISLLIICLLLQLLIFTTRRYSNNKNNYPPPHVSVGRSDSMSLNTINPTPLSVVVASTSNLDGGDLGWPLSFSFSLINFTWIAFVHPTPPPPPPPASILGAFYLHPRLHISYFCLIIYYAMVRALFKWGGAKHIGGRGQKCTCRC